MIKQTITAVLVALTLGTGLSTAEAMPVSAGLSMSAAAVQPGIEKARVFPRPLPRPFSTKARDIPYFKKLLLHPTWR